MTSIGRGVAGKPQEVGGHCWQCSKTFTVSARHYEVFKCGCGGFSWALQPKRGGLYRMIRWLGGQLDQAALGKAFAAPGRIQLARA